MSAPVEHGREQWATRFGFILAAVGSAVGLGNMWRFPYLTAESGGGAFLVLYILMLFVLGLPIMLAEFAVGRGAKRSPIEALAHYGGPAWKPLGAVYVFTGFLILAYYGVIAGWTLRYAGGALVGGFGGDAAARFDQVAGGWDAVLFHLAFMGLTIGIVAGGVRRGIERAALLLMPALFLIVVGIAVYAATLEGAGAGYAFYLQTDFREILSLDVLAQAAGQAFFSLSLGMGAMLTFASYLSRDENLPREASLIAGSDFLVAFAAGLMVFPLIFALDLSSAVGESTVGALFISLPEAFAGMGGAGRPVGFLFFAALLVGALTSAISLLEVVTSSIIDGAGLSRRRAALTAGLLIAAAGIPAAFDLDILGAMDQVATNVLLVGGGFGLAFFVGWVMPDPVSEVRRGGGGGAWLPVWRWFLRLPALVLLGLIFFQLLAPTWEALRAAFGG